MRCLQGSVGLQRAQYAPSLQPACVQPEAPGAKFALFAADDQLEQDLEAELDALDDMVMNRPANKGRDQVKVFGAWLDADVAGRKTGRGNRAAELKAKATRGEALTQLEKGEVFYEEAIAYLEKGVLSCPTTSLTGILFKLK
eukprot:11746-Heterococcus_DN1.PRE.2